MINIFVHSIYLYDDRFTLILNGSGQPITVEESLLEDMEAALDGGSSGSSMVADAPPIQLIRTLRNETVSYSLFMLACPLSKS